MVVAFIDIGIGWWRIRPYILTNKQLHTKPTIWSVCVLVGVGATLINNNQKSICISLNELRGWIPSAAPAGKP